MFFFFFPLSFFFYLQNTKLNLNVAKYDANDADDEDQMDEDDDDEVRQPLFTLATATNLADTLSTKDKSIIAPFKILSCTVENNGFKETQTFNNVFATAERDVLDIVLPKSESNQELLFAADGNTVCIRYELIKNWDLLTKNQPNNQPTLTFTFKTNHDLYDDKSPIENEEFDHNGILKLVIDAESNKDIRALRDLLVEGTAVEAEAEDDSDVVLASDVDMVEIEEELEAEKTTKNYKKNEKNKKKKNTSHRASPYRHRVEIDRKIIAEVDRVGEKKVKWPELNVKLYGTNAPIRRAYDRYRKVLSKNICTDLLSVAQMEVVDKWKSEMTPDKIANKLSTTNSVRTASQIASCISTMDNVITNGEKTIVHVPPQFQRDYNKKMEGKKTMHADTESNRRRNRVGVNKKVDRADLRKAWKADVRHPVNFRKHQSLKRKAGDNQDEDGSSSKKSKTVESSNGISSMLASFGASVGGFFVGLIK